MALSPTPFRMSWKRTCTATLGHPDGPGTIAEGDGDQETRSGDGDTARRRQGSDSQAWKGSNSDQPRNSSKRLKEGRSREPQLNIQSKEMKLEPATCLNILQRSARISLTGLPQPFRASFMLCLMLRISILSRVMASVSCRSIFFVLRRAIF